MKNRNTIIENIKKGGYSEKELPTTSKIFWSKNKTHNFFILAKTCSLGYSAIVMRGERLECEYVSIIQLEKLEDFTIQNLENPMSVIDLVLNLN